MADRRTVKIDILGDASSARKAFGDAGGAADGFGTKLGSIGKAAAIGLAGVGIAAVGMGVSMVKAAMESERVMAQTEAVIKSTGGAAGLTAEQVANMATQLSKVTPFDDEVIQSAENILLTFTNIGGAVMPQATEAVLNMATALGTDANSAALQLGKALNDPIKGVTALGRAGVQFTEAQKEQIKAMVEAGDVAGAQALILGELEKQMGGSARAAGETFAGKLSILKTQLGNVQEEIGARLIPILIPLVTWLGANLPGAIDKLFGFIEKLIGKLRGPAIAAFVAVRDGIKTFVQALQGNWTDDERITGFHRAIGNIGLIIREQVIPAIQAFAGFFQDRLLPIIESAIGVVTGLIDAFAEGGLGGALSALPGLIAPHLEMVGQLFLDLGQKLIDWIEPMIGPALEKLGEFALAIGEWIVNEGVPMLGEKLGAWIDAFTAWAREAVPPMLEALGELLDSLGAWIADEGLPLLFEKLALWGAAFVDWVGEHIVPLLEALGELLLAVGDWIVTHAAPAIAEKLLEWGKQFVAWVQPQIVPLLAALGDLLIQLGDWAINVALPEIIAKLSEWAAAFVAWVGPQIPPLLAELGALLVSVGDWMLTTALPAILEKLAEWAAAFIAWVAPQIPPLLLELGKLVLAINEWIILTALPTIIAKLTEWAKAFLGWIATDVVPELPGKLAAIVAAIGGWVGEVGPQIVKYGADMAYDLLSGLAQYIYDNAAGIVSAIINYIKGLIPSWSDIAGSLIPGGGIPNPFGANALGTGPLAGIGGSTGGGQHLTPGGGGSTGGGQKPLPGVGAGTSTEPIPPYSTLTNTGASTGRGMGTGKGGVPYTGTAHPHDPYDYPGAGGDNAAHAAKQAQQDMPNVPAPRKQGSFQTQSDLRDRDPAAYAALHGGVLLSSGLIGYPAQDNDRGMFGAGMGVFLDGHRVGKFLGWRNRREAFSLRDPAGACS